MSDVRSAITDAVKFYGSTTPLELISRFGSPLYVYNEHVLRACCRDLLGLSSHPGFRVNYSAKANTNPVLLKIIREEGCVVDAMSPGELYMERLAGFTPDQILYVCNNVSPEELKHAVDAGLLVSLHPHFLPFSSVGCPHGTALAVTLDYLCVEGLEVHKVIPRPVIAFPRENSSFSGDYQVILHPNLIDS